LAATTVAAICGSVTLGAAAPEAAGASTAPLARVGSELD
jgi:hypothetical protein